MTVMQLMKRALVTGASEGIGRALSLRLAREGYEVTAVARNEARLDELLRELKGIGHQKIVADLSQASGVQRITDELGRHHYDLVVNNAGFGGLSPFAKQPVEKIREMLALNIQALVEISHAYVRTAKRGDTLVNVASTLSFLPMPAQNVYAATKAFVTSFSESLWYEMKSQGVHVVNLCPGSTASQFTERAGGDPSQIPAFAMQSAEAVVDTVWKSIVRRRGPTCISGWFNILAVLMTRILPRNAIIRVMGLLRA